MGIWIRSQNKEKLINVNNSLCIDYTEFDMTKENQLKAIYGDDVKLGTYSSEEKALKVLDMIETHLEELEYKIHNRNVVFQMPDDESLQVLHYESKN